MPTDDVTCDQGHRLDRFAECPICRVHQVESALQDLLGAVRAVASTNIPAAIARAEKVLYR